MLKDTNMGPRHVKQPMGVERLSRDLLIDRDAETRLFEPLELLTKMSEEAGDVAFRLRIAFARQTADGNAAIEGGVDDPVLSWCRNRWRPAPGLPTSYLSLGPTTYPDRVTDPAGMPLHAITVVHGAVF